MQKGIILFDIKDILLHGRKKDSIEQINQKHNEILDVLKQQMNAECDRRIKSGITKPEIEMFLPTNDAFYLLSSPRLDSILDIASCIMSILHRMNIKAYCAAHIGELTFFTDITGRKNATGYDLDFTSRLLSISKNYSTLTVSKIIADEWGTESLKVP